MHLWPHMEICIVLLWGKQIPVHMHFYRMCLWVWGRCWGVILLDGGVCGCPRWGFCRLVLLCRRGRAQICFPTLINTLWTVRLQTRNGIPLLPWFEPQLLHPSLYSLDIQVLFIRYPGFLLRLLFIGHLFMRHSSFLLCELPASISHLFFYWVDLMNL